MIPKLTAGGKSFQGAALYYLHDKREEGEAERSTSARVAWTYALNLPTQDPDRAWRMMAHTAMTQAELKAAAGVKATGRKLEKPVMAYSLAWSPDEKPAAHEMLEAAQESLAALGLGDHQALIVCHNDTPHPHVHVLVNRVNPETGVADPGSKTRLKLSTWAEGYERSRGKILCAERVENNIRRRDARQPSREKPRTRPHWQASQRDPAFAADIAARHKEQFGEQAAAERAGQQRRWSERAAFQATRRAGRNAIKARYQAALDAAGREDLSVHHARIADALLHATPALALKELTRDRSTFTRQDLARHVGQHTHSVEAFQAVLARLEAAPELVPLSHDDRGRARYTTREHQAMEQRMEDHARALNASTGRPETRPLWPKSMSLSKDQDAALRHVIAPRGLSSIVGYAGTGKSTLLQAARRSWEATGYRVQGMALSGVAADGLKNGSGIDSRTIHSRLAQWEQGTNLPGPKDIIVVDEAGMIGSRQMERVLHPGGAGRRAKVVLVGDPEQLQAIEAGGGVPGVGRHGSARRSSTRIRRQRADWQRDATRELATSQTSRALDRYQAAGMVHAHGDAATAKAALVERWRQARVEAPGDSQIILTFTRADVRDLNERARAVVRAAGALGPDASLKTEAGRRNFAPGDRIYFLKNDAGLGVRNGSLATIERIKGQTIVARLDGEEGRRIMFGMSAYSHIDHGYAATIHKSQGVTVDRAHLLASRNLDRHSSYVAMTRHRDRLDVHWSADSFASREALIRTMSREAAKDTSLDYEAAPAAPSQTERKSDIEALRGQLASRPRAVTTGAVPVGPEPLSGVDRMMQEARSRLAQRQAKEAGNRRLDRLEQKADPAPRAADPVNDKERAKITVTAELIDYDRQTAELAEALESRQAVEIKAEEEARFDLLLDAEAGWQEAMMEPVARSAARQEQKRHAARFEEEQPEQVRRPDLNRSFEP